MISSMSTQLHECCPPHKLLRASRVKQNKTERRKHAYMHENLLHIPHLQEVIYKYIVTMLLGEIHDIAEKILPVLNVLMRSMTIDAAIMAVLAPCKCDTESVTSSVAPFTRHRDRHLSES